jgi:hypothetical protein
MLKGLSDYDLLQFCIQFGGISLLTDHSLLLRACNTAGAGCVVSLFSHISLCFNLQLFKAIVSCVAVVRTGFSFSSNATRLLFMGSQIPLQMSDSIAIICPAAFGFKYHFDIDIPKQSQWMCKQLLGKGAWSNVRT